MSLHLSSEAATTHADRERIELLEEENRLLRAALSATWSDRLSMIQQVFDLTQSEAKIFEALLDANGQVTKRRQIAIRLYGLGAAPKDGLGSDRTIDVFLTKIRVKLRAFNPDLEIKNLWGAGWQLESKHRSIILSHLGESATTTMSN